MCTPSASSVSGTGMTSCRPQQLDAHTPHAPVMLAEVAAPSAAHVCPCLTCTPANAPHLTPNLALACPCRSVGGCGWRAGAVPGADRHAGHSSGFAAPAAPRAARRLPARSQGPHAALLEPRRRAEVRSGCGRNGLVGGVRAGASHASLGLIRTSPARHHARCCLAGPPPSKLWRICASS